MTFEEEIQAAMRATDAILVADPGRNAADPTLPVFRVAAREALEQERARFEAGDKIALLGAIRVCANHDIVMPEWVVRGFIRAYDKILSCRSASWDDAFGKPYPGKHLSKLRQRRELRFQVLGAVREALMATPKPPIDIGLFDEVGKQFGIGATLCAELYYSAHARLHITD